jgi:hypothetical protein
MLSRRKKTLLFMAYSKGFNDGDVSLMSGLTKQRVSYWRNNFGLNAEDVKKLRYAEWARLARAGIDLRFIAFLYRVTENTVRMRLNLIGVSLREISRSEASEDPYSKLLWWKDDYKTTWLAFLAAP